MLSWPGWLTNSGRFTHISGHPSATGRAQDGESSPAEDRRSTTQPAVVVTAWWQAEQRLLDSDREPRTDDEFARLVVQSPHSSMCWLRYVAFKVSAADLDGARAIFDRALQTIPSWWVSLSDLRPVYLYLLHCFDIVSMISQDVALTGRYTTGPPSRAVPWWVTLHMHRRGVLQTMTTDSITTLASYAV